MKKIIPAILILLSSCHKPSANSVVLNIADYPVDTGDSWTYQVSDSIADRIDTARFLITDKYSLNSDTVYFTTQTIISGVVVDSGTIVKSPSSYSYQPNSSTALFERFSVAFPVTQNSARHGFNWYDTLHISSTPNCGTFWELNI